MPKLFDHVRPEIRTSHYSTGTVAAYSARYCRHSHKVFAGLARRVKARRERRCYSRQASVTDLKVPDVSNGSSQVTTLSVSESLIVSKAVMSSTVVI